MLQPSKSHWWIRRFFRSGESERGRRGVADLRRGGRDGCEWRLPPPTDTHTPGCPPRGRGWHSLSLQVLEGRRAALRGAVLAVTRHVHGVHGARVHFHWGGGKEKLLRSKESIAFGGLVSKARGQTSPTSQKSHRTAGLSPPRHNPHPSGGARRRPPCCGGSARGYWGSVRTPPPSQSREHPGHPALGEWGHGGD